MIKTKVSIIIVNYKVKKKLIGCISSIYESKPKSAFEIIVVDNDEGKIVGEFLKKEFPKIKYIKSPRNVGFGAGNNLGAKHAMGEYLFFLNPDTKVFKEALDNLVSFSEKNKNVGIVSPLLLDDGLRPFKTQSRKELTPISAIYSFSFLRKIFPSKSIYEDKFFDTWDKSSPISVDTIPGAALMISKNLFNKVGGFDGRFFLYFEENDLSKRIKNLGYRLYIYPNSKIIHDVGQSTKQIKNRDDLFSKSRFYYLKKHFGFPIAFFTQLFLGIHLTTVFLTVILSISAFLRFYRLSTLMPFIGDQGWFYLSARNLVIYHQIPLVGITASHTWLHQGPFWTYILALILWLFRFNPVSGAYLTSALGVGTVFLIFFVSNKLFSKRVGIIAALFYATSPIVIGLARMPYHTSPIPLFTLLFIYFFYKWIQDKASYFPYVILFLLVLYNFELATQVLLFVLLVYLFYGVVRGKAYVSQIKNKKIIFACFSIFLVIMFPIIAYDISHGFVQTLKFAAWMFLSPLLSQASHNSLSSVISFMASNYQRLIFISNGFVAIMILIFSFIFMIYKLYIFRSIDKAFKSSFFLIALFIIIPVVGFMVNRTPSEAYLPILFAPIIILTALFWDSMLNLKKLKLVAFATLFFVVTMNTVGFFYEIRNSELFGLPFYQRANIAIIIINESWGKEYNIIGKGPGSQFRSFTMNYEYLTWWLGHGSSEKAVPLKFIVEEVSSRVGVQKKIEK
ncbi:glycosyltransferase [Patescibacteria group bacterium]|nr:glycosyltransferase [Patescibacteria group bacterium]